MRFRHKYADPAILFLLVYIFGIILFSFGEVLAKYGYAYMNFLFPRLFPLFSPVSQKEEYSEYLKLLCTVGVSVSLFLINLFALRFDNKKFEFMISKTDGQYRVKDGLVIYSREFLISDVISSVAVPAVLTVLAYIIPPIAPTKSPLVNLLIEALESFLWLGNVLGEYFGPVAAISLVCLFSALSRVILIPDSLKRWRAAWLSS